MYLLPNTLVAQIEQLIQCFLSVCADCNFWTKWHLLSVVWMRDAGLVAIGIVKGRLRQMRFEKVLGCIQVWDESDVSWMHDVTRVDCCWMASCVRCKTSSKLPRRSLKPLLRSSRRAFSPGPCSVRCFMSPFYTTWCAGELENQPFPQESGGGSRRNFFTRPVFIFFGCGRCLCGLGDMKGIWPVKPVPLKKPQDRCLLMIHACSQS